MNRNDKNSTFRVKNVANSALFWGKFLNSVKSAGVKDLTNIMSESGFMAKSEITVY